MKTNHIYILMLLLCTLFLANCKKNKTTTTEPIKYNDIIENTNGELTFKMKNQVDGTDLQLSDANNKVWYKNQNNDSFYVTRFNYYFTNIKLTAEDGSIFEETYSYHLIRQENDSSWIFKIKNIPNKKYVAITYMIGVDSAKNKSGANTGDLSPDYAMHWGWLSGYIFLKFEGHASIGDIDKSLVFHIGGYEGKFKSLKTNTLNFSNPVLINNNNNKTISLSANVNELFKNPEVIDFSQLSFAMTPSTNTLKMAENYKDMFQIVSIN
jgi:hypothetical protein